MTNLTLFAVRFWLMKRSIGVNHRANQVLFITEVILEVLFWEARGPAAVASEELTGHQSFLACHMELLWNVNIIKQ